MCNYAYFKNHLTERVIITVNIAVCEDNNEDLSRLREALKEIKLPQAFGISEYQNAEELIWDVETGRKHFDIFFLDIYLGGMNGVDAARRIRAENENALLIFVSSSEDFYREAFDVYAFHYLVKPMDKDSFADVLERAVKAVDRSRDEFLKITYRGKSSTLKYSDITHISSMNHSLKYHMRDGSEHTSYGKLDELAAQIKSELFVRCHKSFIVNLACVREMTSEGFKTENDSFIPISRTYSAAVKESYHRRLFGIFQDN